MSEMSQNQEMVHHATTKEGLAAQALFARKYIAGEDLNHRVPQSRVEAIYKSVIQEHANSAATELASLVGISSETQQAVRDVNPIVLEGEERDKLLDYVLFAYTRDDYQRDLQTKKGTKGEVLCSDFEEFLQEYVAHSL
jgi:hypothetical protein